MLVALVPAVGSAAAVVVKGVIVRLGGGGAGVISEPLNGNPQAGLKPSLALTAELMSDERLHMRDVWKMTKAHRRGCRGRLFGAGGKSCGGKGGE